jgi:predicted transcriptional regulator
MEVHFAPDVELQLQQVARANGKHPEQLVKDAVARMLERQSLFVAGGTKELRKLTGAS